MKVPPPQPPSDPSGAPPPTALDGPPTAGMCVCVVCSGGVCIALNHCCSVCCATAVLADGAGAGAGAGAGPQHSAAEGPAESEDAFFSKAQGVAMGMLVRAVDKVQVTFSMRQLRNAVVVLVSRVLGGRTVQDGKPPPDILCPARPPFKQWLASSPSSLRASTKPALWTLPSRPCLASWLSLVRTFSAAVLVGVVATNPPLWCTQVEALASMVLA